MRSFSVKDLTFFFWDEVDKSYASLEEPDHPDPIL